MSLIQTVTELNNTYEVNKEEIMAKRQSELREKRDRAREEAVNEIVQDCSTKIKDAAAGPGKKDGSSRKEAKLYEWRFTDNTQFNGCFLRDLFNKGDLLEELQDWFDKNHPTETGACAFKVYYTMMGTPGRYTRPEDRRYGVFVSWDKDDWPRIDDLIQRTKDWFDPSKRAQGSTRGRGRGAHRGRGRGQRQDTPGREGAPPRNQSTYESRAFLPGLQTAVYQEYDGVHD